MRTRRRAKGGGRRRIPAVFVCCCLFTFTRSDPVSCIELKHPLARVFPTIHCELQLQSCVCFMLVRLITQKRLSKQRSAGKHPRLLRSPGSALAPSRKAARLALPQKDAWPSAVLLFSARYLTAIGGSPTTAHALQASSMSEFIFVESLAPGRFRASGFKGLGFRVKGMRV